jgi:hypothetical protein
MYTRRAFEQKVMYEKQRLDGNWNVACYRTLHYPLEHLSSISCVPDEGQYTWPDMGLADNQTTRYRYAYTNTHNSIRCWYIVLRTDAWGTGMGAELVASTKAS